MRASVRIACLVLIAFSTMAASQEVTRSQSENAAPLTLKGRAERVYSSKRNRRNDDSDMLFMIEVKLDANPNADAKTAQKTIFVQTWRSGRLPQGPDEVDGQTQIPTRGDIVEMDVTGGPTTFNAVIPDGIRIILRGSSTSKSTGLELMRIDAGEFLMGAVDKVRPDAFRHHVAITKPFYLGAHEITQGEYRFHMQSKPSAFSFDGTSKDKVARKVTERFPVENVSWFDAAEFCNRLSRNDGFEAYYNLTDVKKEGDSIVSATVTIVGGTGYRLPTEAEWEYACRAGTTTPFHYGERTTSGLGNMKIQIEVGGYGAPAKFEELGRTTKVGSYPANAWGIYDMHGNVAEWCEDWYDKNYQGDDKTAIKDPKGPVQGTHKVMRGGSWLVNESSCRADSRFFLPPGEAKYYGGFRVARSP